MIQPWLRNFMFVCLLASSAQQAFAGPRDAAATLNRCGKPLKGDETVLDNSVAGGHRTLRYERGTLRFDKVALDGWTFVSGEHKRKTDLTAEEMEAYLPCLKDALADSAAPEPLRPVTSTQRMATEVKRDYKTIVLGALALIVASGLLLAAMSRRKQGMEEEA